MPLVPPSQPTHAPECVDITGRSAVTRPPGDSSQPSSPCWTGRRLATATTGRSSARESVIASPYRARLTASGAAWPPRAVPQTFTAMVEGVGAQAVGQGLVSAADWAAGIAGLYRAAGADGTFRYMFFKAEARR